jgi:formate dehydrogenase maturation protein FdhE
MAVASQAEALRQLPRVMVPLRVHVIGSLRRRRMMLPTVIEQVRTEEVAEVPTVIEQVSTEEESEAEVPAVIDKVVQERQVVRVQESQVVL